MGIKVDPRTGMIVNGPCRPSKFPPSKNGPRPKKTDNMFPVRSLKRADLPQEHYVSVSELREFAKEIGLTIAEQLKLFQIAQPSLVRPKEYIPCTPASQGNQLAIDIDESIIDVGIGEQEPLHRGASSKQISTETISVDDLEKSKNMLKRLKGNR